MKFLLAVALCVSLGSAHAAPVPRLWDDNALAQLMRADMAQAGRGGLEQLVTTLGTRLILTTESVGIEQLGDIELLWRLATAVQMLLEVSEPSADLTRVERATAFALFLIGQRYQTRDDFRFAVDGLEAEASGHGKLLLQAVRGMKDYGAKWFLAAHARLSAMGALDVESDHQLGRVLLDTGKPSEAATLLSALFAKAPDRELLRSMCEAMVAVDSPALNQRLVGIKTQLENESGLGLAAELEVCLADHEDQVKTRDFESRMQLGGIRQGEVGEQVARYQRLERIGAAESLARQAMTIEPLAGHIAAAELFFKLERWQSLLGVFASAKAAALSSPRLADLEALSLAGLEIRRAMGSAVPDASDGVAALRGSSLAPLVKRGEIVMVQVARFLGAKKGEEAGALAALDDAVNEVLREHGGEPQALQVVLIAMLASDRLDRGLALIAPKLGALEKAAKKKGADPAFTRAVAEVSSLLARVSLGVAFREGNVPRLEKALAGIGRLKEPTRAALGPTGRAELELAETTGQLALAWWKGKEPSPTLAEGLSAREWALPRTTTTGRTALQARAMTLGTVARKAGRNGDAVSRWLEARALASGSIASLAGGLVQQVIGDDLGAAVLCSRADRDERPALAQLLSACIARGSDPEAARTAWGQVLAAWRDARLGDGSLPPVRPLFYGTFDIGVTVIHGEPLDLLLDARPVVTLAPELVPARAEVETLAR